MAERKFLTDRPLQALRPAKSGTRYELYDSREPTLGVHVIAYYERKHAALPPGVYRCECSATGTGCKSSSFDGQSATIWRGRQLEVRAATGELAPYC